MNTAAIAISAVLLCLTAGLFFFILKNKDNPNSVYRKACYQNKSLRFFPVRSFAYAFFAVVILFFGLLAAEQASVYDPDYHNAAVEFMMHYEKFNTGREYPLMAIKGRETINWDRPRILVIGDSFVWADGTYEVNQVWWGIMSSELKRRGYDCEVHAVGYFGASTEDEFHWLRDTPLLEDIKPDLIVMGYVANDHEKRRCFDIYHPDYMPMLRKNGDAIFSALYRSIASKIFDKNSTHGFAHIPIENIGIAKNYDAQVIQPLGKFIQEIGIPLIVIPTPETPRPGFMDTFRYTLPLFEKAGMPVHNPLDDFIKKYPNPHYRYFAANRVDIHPGPATSWFLGGYAADVLEREYASIIGGQSSAAKERKIEINDWKPYMLAPHAAQETLSFSQYTIEYPDQSSAPDFENHVHGNFLTLPLRKKHVKLSFRHPVRLSSVKIEGEDLLSAEIHTLAINHKLGFDDQKPVRLGKRRGTQCIWTDKSKRDVTSLLISAKTVGGKQAPLTITIEGEVVM